jgi:hypothetical protein
MKIAPLELPVINEKKNDEMDRLQNAVFFLNRKLRWEKLKNEELNKENAKLKFLLGGVESALRLISCPMRPDGTWNRSRESCQKIAEETIKIIENEKNN